MVPALLGATESSRSGAAVAFDSDNDGYGWHGDRYYTSGLRLAYVSDFTPVSDVAGRRWFVGLADELYTPQDKGATSPPAGDHPYSSWLYGTCGLAWIGASTLDLVTLNAGVVGPSARGEQIQSEWHRLIGAPVSRGWDTQLRDEPGVDLAYLRVWRTRLAGSGNGLSADLCRAPVWSSARCATWRSWPCRSGSVADCPMTSVTFACVTGYPGSHPCGGIAPPHIPGRRSLGTSTRTPRGRRGRET